MNYQGSTCVCRVPKAQVRAGTIVECVHCGSCNMHAALLLHSSSILILVYSRLSRMQFGLIISPLSWRVHLISAVLYSTTYRDRQEPGLSRRPPATRSLARVFLMCINCIIPQSDNSASDLTICATTSHDGAFAYIKSTEAPRITNTVI